MANAFSPIRQYGDYIQPYNFDLLAKGLEYKQTRFDANVAMLQQKIDAFANVDILKPQDREYLASRVNTLVESINKTSSMSNFESSGVTRNIQNEIKSVFDQNVMNAVASTANARKLQAEIEDKKKNSPDEYAAQNDLYATRGLRAYLSDGQVGSVYNGGSYTPFYNIQKELLPIMKDLHKYADVEKRTTPTGNGYYVTRSGKRISPEEVRRIAESVLPPQANGQLQIDGWYNFGRGENALENTRQRFETFKNDSLAVFDNQIADLNVRLSASGNGAGSKKEQLQRALTTLNSRKESLRSTYDSWMTTGDIDNMAFTMQKAKLMDGLGARYGFTETELTYSTDQSFWKGQDLKFRRWKAYFDAAEKEKDRQAKAQEKKKKEDELPPIRTQVVPTEPGEDIRLVQDAQGAIENNTLRRDSLLNSKFNSLPANIRGNIDLLYENRSDKEQSKEDFLFDYFRKLSQDATSPGLVSIDEFEQMNSANNVVLANKQVLNEAFDQAVIENEAEVFPKVFEVAKKNPNIKMNVGGTAVPISEYLEFRGIETYEDLENNPEEMTNFKKQVYADLILSRKSNQEFEVRQLAALFGEGNEKVPDDFGRRTTILDRPALGPGMESRGVTTSTIAERRYDIPSSPNSMPKTMAFLRQVQNAGAFDTQGGFVDDSFQDDRESNRLLDPNNLEQKMSSIMAGRKADLPQQNEFLLRTNTDIHEQLLNVINGEPNTFLADDKSPFRIAMDPADLGSVIVKQKVKEGTTGGLRNISDNEARVPIENLPPDIISSINFNNQRPVFNVDNFVAKERGDVSFVDEVNSAYIEELGSSVFDNNIGLMQVSTRQGAALALFKNYPDILGGFTQNTTQVGTVVKNVLIDDRFAVTLKPTKNRDGVRIGVQYDTGPDSKVIYSPNQPITDDNLDQVNKIVDYAPQVMVYNMLNAMLTDIRLNGGQVPNGTFNKLREIYTQNGGR